MGVPSTSGLEMKFGMQSPVAASRLAALEILAIPLVLLRFPPFQTGATPGFVLPELHLQSTGDLATLLGEVLEQ